MCSYVRTSLARGIGLLAAPALGLLFIIMSAGCSKSGVIGTSCHTQTDCGLNQDCVDGQCLDTNSLETRCRVDGDCPFGQVCFGDVCSTDTPATCTADSQCQSGFFCNRDSGYCERRSGSCTTSADCPGIGQMCMDGRCMTMDEEDGGVPEEPRTETPAESIPDNAGGCTQDSQCNPPNSICENSRCVAGCTAQSCGMAVCDSLTGRCRTATSNGEGSACALAEDCSPELVCIQEDPNASTGLCRELCDIYNPVCGNSRLCAYIGYGYIGACVADLPGASVGGQCTVNVACRPNLLCLADAGSTTTGTCRAYCDPLDYSCADGVCENEGDVGACIPQQASADCASNADCVRPQICQAFIDDTKGALATQCSPAEGDLNGKGGTPCTLHSQCASGYCITNSTQNQGFCFGVCNASTQCAGGTGCDALAFDLGGYYDSVNACTPPRCLNQAQCGNLACTVTVDPYDYTQLIDRCWPREGSAQAGQTCQAHTDCLSGLCLQNYWGDTYCYGPCLSDQDCYWGSWCDAVELPVDGWGTTSWVSSCTIP